jgi:membrane protease YdiL (CAAX protease family)
MIWVLLPVFWAACVLAGYFYTQQRNVPWEVAQAVAPAFVLEATLFLGLAKESVRARLEKLPPLGAAGALVAAAVAPYALAAGVVGSFSWLHLGALAVLAAVLAFWYIVLPHNPLSDVGLLAFAASVVLLKVFPQVYARPHEGLALEALGTAMWIRTGLFSILSVRRVKNIGFGFWPEPREWMIGALYFLGLLVVAAPLGWAIDFTRPEMPSTNEWASLPLTFFGTLWVLALGEELFFRGLLQQWMCEWLRNDWAGLIVTSLLFGSLHVFKDPFPNWRFAALAALAGVFYGLAFRQGKGIRASMVTHALTVTTWKTFFT